jgi:hypothetical protein
MANIRAGIEGLETIRAMQQLLDPQRFAKAVRGGIAYAGKAVPPRVAQGISASYALSSARVKKDIEKVRVSPDGTEAVIGFSRLPPTLIQYQARAGSRGPQPGLGRGRGWGPPLTPGKPLTALLLKASGRQEFRRAFVVTGKGGNRIVVERKTRDRLSKLKAVPGPSIGSIFLGKGQLADQLQASVNARVQEQFEKGFDRVWSAVGRGF